MNYYLQVVDIYIFSPLVIGGYFKIGDVGGGNGYTNNHTFYQQDWDLKNCDVIGGNGFVNSHTLSQSNESSSFN